MAHDSEDLARVQRELDAAKWLAAGARARAARAEASGACDAAKAWVWAAVEAAEDAEAALSARVQA